mmetsp:Transcript_8284/g.19344  ORF Transcript_8284/g.19344 Transcript_8284/m.19344 type:complete len:757 (-) Transcript_8284:2630-4900(-)
MKAHGEKGGVSIVPGEVPSIRRRLPDLTAEGGESHRSLSVSEASRGPGGQSSMRALSRAPTSVKRNRVSMLGLTSDDIDTLWHAFSGMTSLKKQFGRNSDGGDVNSNCSFSDRTSNRSLDRVQASKPWAAESSESVLGNSRSLDMSKLPPPPSDAQLAELKLDISSISFLLKNKLDPSIFFHKMDQYTDEQMRDLMSRVSKEQRKRRISGGRTKRSDPDKDMLYFEDFCIVVCRVRKDEVLPPRKEWLPIAPDTFHKQCWDLVVMMLLVFTCFAVPYQMAFDMVPGHVMTPFNRFDLFVDILFMVDVCVNFVTAYHHEGFYVTDMRKIVIHYLCTWFALDFAGSFPIDKILLAFVDTHNTDDLSSLRILKAVRMLKLVRAVKLMDVLSKLQEKEGFATFKRLLQIAKSVFVMGYSAHLIGCIFTMLIDEERFGAGVHWLAAYDPELVEQDNWHRYIAAVYWASVTVSTIGYGDILPVTHIEREFACVMAIFGACIFAYGMGNITSLIQQTVGSGMRFDTLLASTVEWMEYRRLPKDVQGQVKRHLYSSMRRSPTIYQEHQVLASLPPGLTRTVLSCFSSPPNWKQDAELPLFEGLPADIQGAIWSECTMLHFQPSEVIYQAMEVGGSLFVLLGGQVQLIYHNNLQPDGVSPISFHECKSISDTGIFGETSTFEDICKYRPETVIAQTEVKALCISAPSCMKLGRSWPVFLTKLRRMCKLRATLDCVSTAVLETWEADSVSLLSSEPHALPIGRVRG